MEEIRRIDRTVNRARDALASLRQTSDLDNQFNHWEAFLAEWRRALNQIADYLRTAGATAEADAMHAERLADQLLDYVWEARNSEEHTAAGAGFEALVKVTKALSMRGKVLTIGGKRLVLTTQQPSLVFRDLTVTRQRRSVVLTAPEQSVLDVAIHAWAFLERSRHRIL